MRFTGNLDRIQNPLSGSQLEQGEPTDGANGATEMHGRHDGYKACSETAPNGSHNGATMVPIGASFGSIGSTLDRAKFSSFNTTGCAGKELILFSFMPSNSLVV